MNYGSNNIIQHHGILGQKWGVRRYQNKDGSRTTAGNKRYNKTGNSETVKKDPDYIRAHTKKRVEEMSDKELRERLNRLQLEQQYNRLNPSKVDKGKAFVNNTIKTATTIATITTTALTIYNNWEKLKKITNKRNNI